MLVVSPKTARYEGKESRLIPIFPELRPYLEEACASRNQDEWVVTKTRDTAVNLRTRLLKII